MQLTLLLRALVQDARAAEDGFGRVGLPSSVGSVLGILADHGRMRLGYLAQLLGVDPSVASRHVAHAHERGLVVRESDPQDGRAWLLGLSLQGEQRLAEHRAVRGALLDRVLDGWTDSEVGTLVDALTRLRDDTRAVRATDPPTPRRSPSRSTASPVPATFPILEHM